METLFWSLKMSDLAIIFATLVGPILAVQAQRIVERRREKEGRRTQIFRVLMATRLANLSVDHVEALNAIPIEFYGNKRSYKEVVQSWKEYLDHLTDNPDVGTTHWATKRQEMFNELLFRLSKALGYSFSRVELKREVYAPQGHLRIENEQDVIRQGLYRIFNGEAALPLDIKSIQSDPAILEQQKKIQALIEQWLAGQSAVKVDFGTSDQSIN